MAKHNTRPELFESFILVVEIKVILKRFSIVDSLVEGHYFKHHLVGSKGASLISEDAVDDS